MGWGIAIECREIKRNRERKRKRERKSKREVEKKRERGEGEERKRGREEGMRHTLWETLLCSLVPASDF